MKAPEQSIAEIADELERNLAIDEHHLDKSLLNQTENFAQAAILLSRTLSDRDAAKLDLSVLEAEIDAEVRHHARVHEEKLTEKEVESKKRADPRIDKQIRLVQDLGEQVSLLTALKESYTQRAYALKLLVELYTANYFTTSEQTITESTLRNRRGEARRADYEQSRAPVERRRSQ